MPVKRKKTKALLLFSGGLDSILAAKILERQGIDVMALTYVSYFFDAEQAKKSAKENGIKLVIRDISRPHFEIVKNPLFGRGAGMNPCVDCHLLMLREAKKITEKENYDFIATGEVLGQRPMSQNIRALDLIERKAGLVGKILRPLSARVLSETEHEKKNLVDREKLAGISGRSRKVQLALAKKFGVKYFPAPAGGCILTDKEYSKKLKKLFEILLPPPDSLRDSKRAGCPKNGNNGKNIKKSDIDLLRLGRHFWLGETRIILGRNHAENLALKKIAEKYDILIEPKEISGPTALVRGSQNKAALDFAKKLLSKYIKNSSGDMQVKIITK